MIDKRKSTSSGHLGSLTIFESEALDSLREKIPDILYQLSQSEHSLWGTVLRVSGQTSHIDSEKEDIILLKFLRARDFDVLQATEMLSQCIAWRIAEKIEKIYSERLPDFCQGHDEYDAGRDRFNRPILLTRFGDMDAKQVFGNVDTFVRYRVAVFERGIESILPLEHGKPETLCCIQDFARLSVLSHSHMFKNCIEAIAAVLGNNYPEWNGISIYVNFPTALSILLGIAMMLLSEKTRSKVLILREGEYLKLLEVIAPGQLYIEYGGFKEKENNYWRTDGEYRVINASSDIKFHVLEIPTGSHKIIVQARSLWGEMKVKIFCNSDKIYSKKIEDPITTNFQIQGPAQISISWENTSYFNSKIALFRAQIS